MRIELRNYRAFDDSRPAIWDLKDGFTAFVGVNNSGKSSLLRFFHEARDALTTLNRMVQSDVQAMLSGRAQGVQFRSVADQEEVFCNRNTRDMTATFYLDAAELPADGALYPSAVRYRWHRPGAAMTVEFEVERI